VMRSCKCCTWPQIHMNPHEAHYSGTMAWRHEVDVINSSGMIYEMHWNGLKWHVSQ
jgi:hypothetical protein